MSKRIEALLDNKALFLNSALKEAQEEKSRLSMLLSRNKQRINEIQEEKASFISQFKDTKYQELLAIKKEQRNVESEINAIKFQNKKQSIISPTDGFVAKMMINTIGGVVTPAEKLISIVPKDAPLIVKVNVLNQDIGFIKNHMISKIKIDTFSFQKYGFFEGENRKKSEQFHFCRFGTGGYVPKGTAEG